MQQASSPVHQQLRSLHPEAIHGLHQAPDGALYPQPLPELQPLHPSSAVFQHPPYPHDAPPPPPPQHVLPIHFEQHAISSAQFPPFQPSFQHAEGPPFAVNIPRVSNAPSHFGAPQAISSPLRQEQLSLPLPIIAAPQPPKPPSKHVHLTSRPEAPSWDGNPLANHGQFQGLKLIPHPPDLEAWRRRLFDVDDMITLTEDEFQTYFPHVDNVYSHRSTQRHKRRRFVSHYWDCRLKGRPPGTKKSTDPEKKKRKRIARERDLCDVKVKITEYFDQQEYEDQVGHIPPGILGVDPTSSVGIVHSVRNEMSIQQGQQFYSQPQGLGQQSSISAWDVTPNLPQPAPQMAFEAGPHHTTGSSNKKLYTIQRVNGNGGNGKADGVAGPHKHTLEESDRVKKNSVIRWQAKIDKDEKKKIQGGDSTEVTYHKKATGNALITAKNHSKEEELRLYGSCFCPFVQRVWISLEYKRIPYQYIEIDPYKKPQTLLDINPRGLVPALRHGPIWSTHDSGVIMEYLEDLRAGPDLLPPSPQDRATSRLWTDHVNRHIVPLFYQVLQAQDANKQAERAKELNEQIAKLVNAAHTHGPFFLGPQISFVDVQVAPWMLRLRRVLGVYRGWPEAKEGSRLKRWMNALENEESVRMTTSTDELYVESYERYAENRPGTSQVADAVNAGRGLP